MPVKSPAELANWPGSDIRKQLLGEEVAHNFRDVREYAMSGGARVDSGYTRVIARKVRAGKDGRHEIDALVERGVRQVVAIEVKVTASPNRDDARHPRWLAEWLGQQFAAGALPQTGG